MKSKIGIILGITLFIYLASVDAQPTSKFPAEKIDTAIINKRGLQEQVRMLVENCDWTNRLGGKIDVFWLKQDNVSFFGYVYEYIMDCDNVRLIYWYMDAGGTGQIVDFMVENAGDESYFVVAKKKQLKNKKKYQQYFTKPEE